VLVLSLLTLTRLKPVALFAHRTSVSPSCSACAPKAARADIFRSWRDVKLRAVAGDGQNLRNGAALIKGRQRGRLFTPRGENRRLALDPHVLTMDRHVVDARVELLLSMPAQGADVTKNAPTERALPRRLSTPETMHVVRMSARASSELQQLLKQPPGLRSPHDDLQAAIVMPRRPMVTSPSELSAIEIRDR
jgi:hypothetical protein